MIGRSPGRPPLRYTLHFEWPDDPRAARDSRRLLAEDLQEAKVEAAILYACVDLSALPSAYRIVKGARQVVYRYPE